MAWVTRLGPDMAQVEYRLTGAHGCAAGTDAHAVDRAPADGAAAAGDSTAQDHAATAAPGRAGHADTGREDEEGQERRDPAVDYRTVNAERPLRWFGSGLKPGFGIEPGSVLHDDDLPRVRRMMAGAHPDTGEVLMTPKLAIAPAAKLPGAALLQAARRHAALARDPHLAADPVRLREYVAAHSAALDGQVAARLRAQRPRELYRRIARGVAADADLYQVPALELRALAEHLGIDIVAVYGEEFAQAVSAGYEQVKQARGGRVELRWRARNVEVGNRGYDVTATFPKGISAAMALFDEQFAEQAEAMLGQATVTAATRLEDWAAYGMRGHHGGRRDNGSAVAAERVDAHGFVGWATVHRAARPVEGAPVGDPHWHTHLTFANMVQAIIDGQWSTLASGGRDLFRHAHAFDALLQALVRYEAQQHWGFTYQRNHAGIWDIAGFPPASLALFSKRDAQIKAMFAKLHLNYDSASLAARKHVSATTRQAKTAAGLDAADDVLRAYWQAEANGEGYDADAIAAEVFGRAGAPTPGVEEIAAAVFDPEHGVTAHDKRYTWADLYTAVLDQLPGGIADPDQADRLVAQVLAHRGYAVGLPATGPQHYTHPQLYTTSDVTEAERTILGLARAGYQAGWAVVDEASARQALAAFQRERNLTLSDEQIEAFHRLVHAGHGVDAVVGVAGAGKTTVMAAVRAAFEAEGLVVEGASTAAVAVAGLRRAAGLGTARTIASYLQAIDAGYGLTGVDVLIVDEAGMADERDMARLLAHARDCGTKVIGIGDPAQLRSPGIGGTFARVHILVHGVSLTENRRQTDPIERRAVHLLRRRDWPAALRTLARRERLHIGRTRQDALAAALALWSTARADHRDPHDLIRNVLLLAAVNEDVDALNLAARALRKEAGELGEQEIGFPVTGADDLTLAVGDIVLIKVNDYRARTDAARADVLNGYRAVVAAVDEDGVQVTWREQDADGAEREVTETLDRAYIAGGGLALGLAVTGHKSQGMTTGINIALANGMRGNALYEAATRGREQNHLVYSQDHYEQPEDARRYGPDRGLGDLTARVIRAVAKALKDEQDEVLVIEQLGWEQVAPIGLERTWNGPPPPRPEPGDPDPPDPFDHDALDLPDLLRGLLSDPVAAAVLAGRDADVLRARLAAHAAIGEDPRTLLAAVIRDRSLPPLSAAANPAGALIWRVDRAVQGAAPARRTGPVSAQAAALLPDPIDPQRVQSLVDNWTQAAARSGAHEMTGGAVQRAPDAQAAYDTALASAHRLMTTRQAAVRLRERIDAGFGPAAARVRAVRENLAERGAALEEMAQLALRARRHRDALDALADPADAPGPERRAAMSRERAALDAIAGRWIALDAVVGAERGRDALLTRWRQVRDGYTEHLTQAEARDQARLAAAERAVTRAHAATAAATCTLAAVRPPAPPRPDRPPVPGAPHYRPKLPGAGRSPVPGTPARPRRPRGR